MIMVRQRIKCSRCGKSSFWNTSDNRLKCVHCRVSLTYHQNILKIPPYLLKKIISEFLLEHSTNTILSRVNISKYGLLKILTLLRKLMTAQVPDVFEGIVEVDETYLGGQWKNKRLSQKTKLPKPKRGRGTFKQPIFGILCRKGLVWAELIDGAEKEDLQPLIQKQVKAGSTVMSDTWKGYTGIASKGYVHRLVKHEKDNYVSIEGNHINGLEGFWGYLKRKLAAKGGIRKSRLSIFLGEYVWRYNHRKLDVKEQERLLYSLIKIKSL
jgi:transposase